MLIPNSQGKNLESQTSITIKWIVLITLLIGCFKNLIAALMRQTLNCLFVQLHSVQENHLVILM